MGHNTVFDGVFLQPVRLQAAVPGVKVKMAALSLFKLCVTQIDYGLTRCLFDLHQVAAKILLN